LDAALVSAAAVISLTSPAADTRGKVLEKVVVAVAVEAITSLADDGFLMKSSVGKPTTTQSVSTSY
jgi:hypothetical protein